MSVAMKSILGVAEFVAVVFAVCVAPGIAGRRRYKWFTTPND